MSKPADPPARIQEERTAVAQFVERAGVLDLAWGHPDPALLPVGEVAQATAQTFERFGAEALAYGAPAGPGPLREALRDRLAVVDGRRPAPAELCVTAGISSALDQVSTLLGQPGDVVLVEAPTYHFALRILEGHRFEVRAVPFDEEGLVVEALPGILASLHAKGRKTGFLYTIPTFHNPTGITLSDGRRKALVALAAEEGLVVVEDDAYRELAFDGPAPPSLWSLAPAGTVVRLGSFAKSLAPGLRVGFLTADDDFVARFAGQGQLLSGGALSHLPSLLVATYMEDGSYAANVEKLKAGHRERRDALLDALSVEMPAGTTWTRPGGGYFTWVTLPSGDAAGLLATVRSHGSGYVPGSSFGAPLPDALFAAAAGRSFRLAWSRYPPEVLRESVRRLGEALRVGRGGRPDRP